MLPIWAFRWTIDARLRLLAPTARVFSYLDDGMVVLPASVAEQGFDAVKEGLAAAGLALNESKTVAWTADPTAQLPPRLAPFRKLTLGCLGAAAPWVDREDLLSRLVARSQADGNEAHCQIRQFTEMPRL